MDYVNIMYYLCAEGYIPQYKMEDMQDEIPLLFRKDEGKWINGKYYTAQQLKDMDTSWYKNDGFLNHHFIKYIYYKIHMHLFLIFHHSK